MYPTPKSRCPSITCISKQGTDGYIYSTHDIGSNEAVLSIFKVKIYSGTDNFQTTSRQLERYYIYINAGVLLEFDERGKKSGVCVSFCSFLRRQTFSQVFFKTCFFLPKWRWLKIHQKNNSFSSAQCVRNFSIEMKRELKMNTQNTRSGMYLCVHFQRYLFANVEDMGTKRERFSQKREVAFCWLFVAFCSYTHDKRASHSNALLPNEEIPQHARDI